MADYFFPIVSMIAYALLIRKLLKPRAPPKKPENKKTNSQYIQSNSQLITHT